jgi:hypothetical protein
MANVPAKDMHRMPPTTEPLSRNFLDETVFWIIAAEQERRCGRTRAQRRALAGARTLSFALGDLPRACSTR